MTPSAQARRELKPISLPITRAEPLDPDPELEALRQSQPLCRLLYPDGHIGWLVSSYALARELLLDSRFGISPPRRRPAGNAEAEAQRQQGVTEIPEHAGVLISLDPPQHTRVRRALAGHFTVRRIGEHRSAIEAIVESRLDVMAASEQPVDFVETFAVAVSSLAICELLGVQFEDRRKFEIWTAVIGDPSTSGSEKVDAEAEFFEYCRSVISSKHADPESDLLSELIIEGELDDTELTGVAFQLFEAGHATTASMLGLSAFSLLSSRGLWDELKAEPEKIEAAVEELLRYLTIVQTGPVTRTALEDCEIDGTPVYAGESVTVSLAAANRDPAKFANPDELDFSRPSRGHVSFGHGRHMCIGQHLARLEMQVSLAALVRRFPTLRLAVAPDEVPFENGAAFLYSLAELPVEWEVSE